MKNSKFHNLTFSINTQNGPVWQWYKETSKKEYSSLSDVVSELERVVQPLPQKTLSLSKNITIHQGSFRLKDSGFANFIELETNSPKVVSILENKKQQSILDILEDRTIKAASTLAYEFLSDEVEGVAPTIKTYNLAISDGELKQLPVLNRSAFVVHKNGVVEPKFTRAKGTLKFKNFTIPWWGSLIADKSFKGAIAYNCSSGRIEHRSGGQWFGRKRIATLVTTPAHADRFDITLKKEGGRLVVEKKIPGGGSDVNSSNFIFSLSNYYFNKLKIGEPVTKIALKDLDLAGVESAITVGPLVPPSRALFTEQIKKEFFDRDPALTENPFELDDRTARGILYKSNNKYNLLIVDAIPNSKKFPGVTPAELLEIVYFKNQNIDWAVMIDPGQTLKFGARVYSDKGLLFGNTHYCRPSKRGKGGVVLNSLVGRIREYYLVFREVG